MKFLIDEALQEILAEQLLKAGHDATHVRLLGLQGASDQDVLELALREDRVVVTTDTDFGTLLALSGDAGPSVVLLRGVGDSPAERLSSVLKAISVAEATLRTGAVVVVGQDRIRLRRLPIEDG